MFSSIGLKIALYAGLAAAVGGAYLYVKTLQSDLEIAKANQAKLEAAVETQQAALEQMKLDFAAINAAKGKLEAQQKTLQAELTSLDEKFNKTNASGEKRDLGDLAVRRSKAIERVINNGSAQALRCVEIAMGSPLTEKEQNATKNSEINPLCPSIANPNYVAH